MRNFSSFYLSLLVVFSRLDLSSDTATLLATWWLVVLNVVYSHLKNLTLDISYRQGLSIRQPIPDNYFKSKKDKSTSQKYFDLRENYFDEKHRLVDKLRHDLKGKTEKNFGHIVLTSYIISVSRYMLCQI